MLAPEGKTFVGFFWTNIKENDLMANLQWLQQLHSFQYIRIPKDHLHIAPPTQIPSNAFFWGFQEIVNTYGVPWYKELNPAVWACISFPFLFGVMFGDIAHGFLLFLVGAGMCLFESKLWNAGLGDILMARYLVLLMGFFATFCGIMYNDFASLPIEVFGGTCYDMQTGA